MSILPPHVVHDGRPATSRGYVKRVVYLDNGILGDELIGRAVDDPVLRGRAIRRKVSALIDALGCADMLEAETRLAFLVEQIRSSLGAGRAVDAEAPKERLAEEFRAYLDRNLFERATVADAAAEIGASPTKLARIFAATYRIPPHAYVTGRRLEAARQRILDGRALADVAAEVGFADQAHLTRRFASFLGVTPGEFARGRRHTV